MPVILNDSKRSLSVCCEISFNSSFIRNTVGGGSASARSELRTFMHF